MKLGVLLQYIAKEEKIEISEDELSKGIMQYAGQYPGQEKQIMEYLKNNPSSVESIRGPLLEDKIINTITKKSVRPSGWCLMICENFPILDFEVNAKGTLKVSLLTFLSIL